MLDLAGRPLDLAAEVHTRGSEDLQVMDGIHHKQLNLSNENLNVNENCPCSIQFFSTNRRIREDF